MKKIIFLLTFLCFIFSYSQQKSFNIEWNGIKTLSTSASRIEIPSFSNDNLNYSFEDGLTFVVQWKINGLINENSLVMSNVSYAPISRSELKDMNLKTIPKEVKFKFRNSIARGKLTAFLEISPIIHEQGVYRKITAFTISYNNTGAGRLTSRTHEISNSVLSQGEWYKFYIDTTGVFRLTKSFLNDLIFLAITGNILCILSIA